MRERAATLVADSPGVVPASFGVAIFVFFAADEGGFRGTTWYPAALLLLALLAVLLVTLPRPRPSRLGWIAILAMAAYAAWSYLSILWANQQGIAWDGANRTVFYALVVASFALWPIKPRPAAVIAGAWGLGVAGVGLVELLRVAAAANPASYLPEGRLAEPAGYANANVALWFSAFLPCAILAGRRETPVPVRGLLLGAAGLLAGLAVLGQSRAWFFGFPPALLLAVALVPGRARTIAAVAAVGAALLPALDSLLNVYDSFEIGVNVAPEVDDATRALVFSSTALAVVGGVAAALERGVRVEPRTAARLSAGIVIAFLVALGAGAIAFVAVKGNPVTVVSDAWDDFRDIGSTPQLGEARFGGDFTSYRYDYWRVAYENFERRPIAGVGVDNFAQDYLVRGKSFQQPTYPHSVELRALSQTGLIGALLLFASLAALVWGPARHAWRDGGLGGVVAGTGVVVFAYWLLHGTFDWLWEFPGLGGPALALPAMGLALAEGRADPEGLSVRRLLIAAGALVAALAAAGLTLPYLAERDLRKGYDLADENPAEALDRFDRAASLNRLSALPIKAAGVVLAREGRYGAAEHEFRRALERDPRDAYSYLQLGAIASQGQRPYPAKRLLAKAVQLAPRDAATIDAWRAVKRGRELNVAELDAKIRKDIDVRLGRR